MKGRGTRLRWPTSWGFVGAALVLEAIVIAPAFVTSWPATDALRPDHLLFFMTYIAIAAGWLVSGLALVATILGVGDVRAGRLVGARAYCTVVAGALLCVLAPWTFLLYSALLYLTGGTG